MRRYLAALAIPGIAVAVALSGGTSSAAGSTAPTAPVSTTKKVELEKTKLRPLRRREHHRSGRLVRAARAGTV